VKGGLARVCLQLNQTEHFCKDLENIQTMLHRTMGKTSREKKFQVEIQVGLSATAAFKRTFTQKNKCLNSQKWIVSVFY